mgnify:CR=1 FL=1
MVIGAEKCCIFQLFLLMVNFVDQGEDLMLQLLNLFKQLDLFFIFSKYLEIHIVKFLLLKLKRRPCLIHFTFFGPQQLFLIVNQTFKLVYFDLLLFISAFELNDFAFIIVNYFILFFIMLFVQSIVDFFFLIFQCDHVG